MKAGMQVTDFPLSHLPQIVMRDEHCAGVARLESRRIIIAGTVACVEKMKDQVT